MKHCMMWVAFVLLLIPIVACQEDTPLSPPVEQHAAVQPFADPEQIALAIMGATGWPRSTRTEIPSRWILLKATRVMCLVPSCG